MTSVDGVYWALAIAILLIAAALAWLLVRLSGSVGRVNRILTSVGDEVPASAASVRKILEDTEKVAADLATTTAVIREAAEGARLVVDRFRAAVNFLDEHIFSKVAVLAPLFAAIGGFIGRFAASRFQTPQEEKAPNAEAVNLSKKKE